MRIKETLRKVWTWRRDRAARRLRERIVNACGWYKVALLPEETERRIAYITAAPLREWKLREEHFFSPGGVVTAEHSEKLTDLLLSWILRGEGLRELKKELEHILELSSPRAQTCQTRHNNAGGRHGQARHSR